MKSGLAIGGAFAVLPASRIGRAGICIDAMRLLLPILASLLLLVPLAGGLRHGAPAIWAKLCDGHLIALDASGKPIPDRYPDCTPIHAVVAVEGGAIPDRVVRVYPAQAVAVPSLAVVVKVSVIRARGPPMSATPST